MAAAVLCACGGSGSKTVDAGPPDGGAADATVDAAGAVVDAAGAGQERCITTVSCV
jgi:hypothetical protein